MRYRKKPVIIEAIKYLGPFSIDEMLEAWGEPFAKVMVRTGFTLGSLSIKTLEGTLFPSIEDWIIRGIQGEFYPCKPDIFEATYEAVDDQPSKPSEQ